MASAKIYQHLLHAFLAINRDPKPPERQHRIYLHFSDPHAILAGETLSSSYGLVSSTAQYRRNPFAISVGLLILGLRNESREGLVLPRNAMA